MRSMQGNSRTTESYYVQWFDERRNEWITQTNDLTGTGYATLADARTDGVAECFAHSGPPERWPAWRIIKREIVESVVESPGEAPPGVLIKLPGALADHLADSDNRLIRPALDAAAVVRAGRSYYLAVTAPLSTHGDILRACWVLAPGSGGDATPTEHAAYRTYQRRIDALRSQG